MAVKFEDYYQVLGVSRDATAAEIQRAYRKLARQYHPDVNKAPDAQQKFARINEAYEVLKDPEKRKRYDELGRNYKAGQEFRPPPGFEEMFAGSGRGGQSFRFQTGGRGFSEFFEAFFGGQSPFARGRTGGVDFEDLFTGGAGPSGAPNGGAPPEQEASITISLEEAYRGTTRRLEVQSPDGKTKTIDVKIPAGTRPGQKIRLRGERIVLRVNVSPHPRFELDRNGDLTTEIKITPSEAALGAKVDLPLIDGKVTVTVPPGSSSGARLRLRGQGMPTRTGDRGDLYVRLTIVVPKTLTDAQRRLYESLRTFDENPRQ